MATVRSRSVLHLQLGQEILYLLIAVGLMTSLVLLLYVQFLHAERAADADDSLHALQTEVYRLRQELAKAQGDAGRAADADHSLHALQTEVYHLREELAKAQAHNRDQPPIITLSEADGYSFPSGTAMLSESFQSLVRQRIIPNLLALSERYDANVIEIIGHTDEVPVKDLVSTIDQSLLSYLHNDTDDEPTVSDNVSLGMIRAAAVLRVMSTDTRLNGFKMLPLSAGQAVSPRHELAAANSPGREDAGRRRIEIRLRRDF